MSKNHQSINIKAPIHSENQVFSMNSRKILSLEIETEFQQLIKNGNQTSTNASKCITAGQRQFQNIASQTLGNKGNKPAETMVTIDAHIQKKRFSQVNPVAKSITPHNISQRTSLPFCWSNQGSSQVDTLKHQIIASSKLPARAVVSRNATNGIVKYLSNPITTTNAETSIRHTETTSDLSSKSAIIKSQQWQANKSESNSKQVASTSYSNVNATQNSLNTLFGLRKTSVQTSISQNCNQKAKEEAKEKNEKTKNSGPFKKVATQYSTTGPYNHIRHEKANQITPPFSVKNLILSQMTSNYSTIKKDNSSFQKNQANISRNTVNEALSRMGSMESNSNQIISKISEAKSQGTTQRITKRTSIDLQYTRNNRDYDAIHPLSHKSQPQILMTPSHSNHTKNNKMRFSMGSMSGDKDFVQRQIDIKKGTNDKKEELIIKDKLSPVHYQNEKSINRPQTKVEVIGMPLRQRLSLDHTGYSIEGTKLLNDTHPQRAKFLTPSDDDNSISSNNSCSSDECNINDVAENNCSCGSALDTIATTSIIEGNTSIKLPVSQIATVTSNAVQAIDTLNSERTSVKTTERYQRPFVRPQVLISSTESINDVTHSN